MPSDHKRPDAPVSDPLEDMRGALEVQMAGFLSDRLHPDVDRWTCAMMLVSQMREIVRVHDEQVEARARLATIEEFQRGATTSDEHSKAIGLDEVKYEPVSVPTATLSSVLRQLREKREDQFALSRNEALTWLVRGAYKSCADALAPIIDEIKQALGEKE